MTPRPSAAAAAAAVPPRAEDLPLLRGEGRFPDDTHPEGCAEMVFLRSDVSAGRILGLNVETARAMPGVLAVLGVAELDAMGIGHLGPSRLPATSDGLPVHVPPFPGLADGAVLYPGQPILGIVAETGAQARDAAEAIDLQIAETPAVTDLSAAKQGPDVWPTAPGNRVFVHSVGDQAAVAKAMAEAAHLITQRLTISRVTAAPMEPRGALAVWDAGHDSYTITTGTQAPHGLARTLAGLLGTGAEAVRVVSGHCGGSFGMRNGAMPEYLPLLAAARRLGRPVKWIETRSESFLADPQAREQIADATLALDADGRFLALSVDIVAAMGAFIGPSTLHSSVGNLGSLAGVYRFPAIHARVEGLHLNTQSVAAYRGAGRPEATYITERMIDLAATRMGIDRAELRRRNMITPADLPRATPLGFVYDSGDFPAALDRGLAAAHWSGFAARRAEAATRGRLRGIGLACSIEIAGGPVAKPGPEYARIDLSPDGCEIRLGSGDSGQGHAATFPLVVAEVLGLAPETIRYVSGDTSLVAQGMGTFGSRSLGAAGGALQHATEEVLETLTTHAAAHFEVPVAEVAFADGVFRAEGTNRTIDVADLVAALGLSLSAERFEGTKGPTYPNGCHIAEVEIDPDTGLTEILSYVAVEDLGRLIHPALAIGQIQGGVAQGIGQALAEAIRHDPTTGQPLTGSFMDYAMPRAGDMPFVQTLSQPTATDANPLGTKGAGEAGVVGALPALASAVADALSPLGIDHVDMPATPSAIWAAINSASRPDQGSEAC